MPDAKIEPWMVAAAKEVIEAEGDGHLFRTIRNEMETTEGRRAGTDRDATQRTYEALAAIIARHAPDPASVPIGPGDVVQFKVAYTPPGYALQFDENSTMFDSAEVVIVDAVQMGGAVVEGLGADPIPFDVLTRIGRAVYWPDGSKVEEGK